MWDKLFSSVDMLEQGLGAAWLRNQVIGNNIANADTPGYKTYEVKFEDAMASALGNAGSGVKPEATNSRHIGGGARDPADVTPQVAAETNTSAGLDENNVDIETEMVALAKNSIEYYALVSKINSEFANLKTVINSK